MAGISFLQAYTALEPVEEERITGELAHHISVVLIGYAVGGTDAVS